MATPFSSDAPAWLGPTVEPSVVVSDERVEEILNALDGFVVHEYEPVSDVVNGRAVHSRVSVGADFNLDKALEWAMREPDVAETFGPTVDGDAAVELVDGNVLEWMPAERCWAATICDGEAPVDTAVVPAAEGDPQFWPPLPGDIWHLHPTPLEDTTCPPVQVWVAIAVHDYTAGDPWAVTVELTQPTEAGCDWEPAQELAQRGEMRLHYRDGEVFQ